ncbi:MAG: MCE family protein [Holophagales bacterium]|nr:MCE family protein [Holophagales bacterium]
MSERSRNLRVGVFALGAVLLLVGGLFALGFRESLAPRVRIETAVTGDVQGLAVGSGVEIRGIRVGKVTGIGFTWNDYPETKTDLAVVRFEVKRSILPSEKSGSLEERLREQIGKGLRVRIRSQALTGTSVLSIERVDPKLNPPPAIDYEPHDLYVPSAPSQFTRMVDAIERTLDMLQEIRVQPILDRVESAVASVEEISRRLATIRVDRIEAKANVVADEAVFAAKDLHAGLASAREQIQQLKLGENGERVARLLEELRATTVQLRTTLEKVDGVDVEGLNEAITGLKRASDTLDQTLQEVRDYPAGSLLGKAPKPAASVEDREKKK